MNCGLMPPGLDLVPLWARRAVYLVALAFFPVAVALGWLDDSTAARITGALGVALVPGLALAHPTRNYQGRHRDDG